MADGKEVATQAGARIQGAMYSILRKLDLSLMTRRSRREISCVSENSLSKEIQKTGPEKQNKEANRSKKGLGLNSNEGKISR